MTTVNLQTLQKRSRLIELTRGFFRDRDYLEVDTALLCPFLIPESSLEVFGTRYRPREGSGSKLFLIPSPELWMKRLLAEGSGSLFQICKSFRNGEPATAIHAPEFTMLEWYTVGEDYLGSVDIIEDLFAHLCEGLAVGPLLPREGGRVDCSRPFLRLSMAEAFQEYLGLDLPEILEAGEGLMQAALSLDLPVSEEDRPQDLFHKIFLSAVEPNLPSSRALILYDYPALIPTLARRKGDGPWVERWELYLGGVETANCYSEETDAAAYKSYFLLEDREKRKARVVHPADWELVETITELGLPECSGVAMGLERLFLFFLGLGSIRDVLPYGAFFPSGDTEPNGPSTGGPDRERSG
jgi:lysyl-tRNA synthetase class 2